MPKRVVQLAAEAFCRHAGAKALARGVDRGCRTGGTTADHQHFERVLGGQLLGCLGFAGSVDLGEDFGQFELAVVEGLAVEEGRGDRHHVARFDFVLEGSAFDQRGRNARIFKRQQRQRLHHVRTVVTRKREIHLEVEIAFEPANLFEQVRIDLGRVSTGPQQREHQRGEFVTHRKARETHPLFRIATAADDEAGRARVGAVEAGADEIVQRGNLFEQLARLLRFFRHRRARRPARPARANWRDRSSIAGSWLRRAWTDSGRRVKRWVENFAGREKTRGGGRGRCPGPSSDPSRLGLLNGRRYGARTFQRMNA